jgi:hypothetical protein
MGAMPGRGARVAVVVQRTSDVDTLFDRVLTGTRVYSVSVISVLATRPVALGWMTMPCLSAEEFLIDLRYSAATSLAHEVVTRLPPECSARYTVHAGWWSACLRAALHDGAFDAVIFASWPAPGPTRRLIRRAAVSGGARVIVVPRRRSAVVAASARRGLGRRWSAQAR